MKNKFLHGAAALALCAGVVSCSEYDAGLSDTATNLTAQQEAVVKEYTANFTARYGAIDPNHTWGFGDVATTRSIIKEKHELPNGLEFPELADGEADYVMKWFAENPGANSETIDISNFFIVYVGNKTNVNVKYHDWDQNNANNNKTNTNFVDKVSTQTVNIDQLWINGEHINDWNANGGVTLYVHDSKVADIKGHNSYCQTWTTEWKLAYIDVPGVGGGWYVGLTAYGKKLEGDGQYETLPGSGIYEDRAQYTDYDRAEYFENWVFKIVPGEGSIIPNEDEGDAPCRIMCEDLGSTSDFDFNDIVFDVESYTKESDGTYTANIKVQAAGGTLPVYIGSVAEKNEVHYILTKTTDTDTQVNVGPGTISSPAPHQVKGLAEPSALLIELYVLSSDNAVYQISNNYKEASAPQKIRVPIKTAWTKESQQIEWAYPGFPDYVTNENTNPWSNAVSEFLY